MLFMGFAKGILCEWFFVYVIYMFDKAPHSSDALVQFLRHARELFR